MTKKHLVLLATVFIFGLATASAANAQSSDGQDKAKAGCDYADAIGKNADEAKKLLPQTGYIIRILTPNMIVTQEYSASRINLDVDANNIVQKVSCW